MPTFATPQPITANFDLAISHVKIVASRRADTVVTVTPADSAKKADVSAAEHAQVEYANGQLSIVAAHKWRLGNPGAIDISVELPAGSRLDGKTGMGDFETEGPLDDCRLKTSLGKIRLAHASTVRVRSGSGRVTVDHAEGNVEISAAGDVRVGTIGGTSVIKNSNGDVWIGEAIGDVRANLANGAIDVDRAHGSVTAKTANGEIRVGEITRGTAILESAVGDLEVGLSAGSAAWLDVRSRAGRVHNTLTGAASPADTEERVEVHARTSTGDILIRRA